LKEILWELTPVDEFIKRIKPHLKISFNTKNVSLDEAIGKISAENITSNLELPPYPKSVMDGYAVTSDDCSGASHISPAILKVNKVTITSGKKLSIKAKNGEAIPIETGGYLPEGTDAVVKLEDTIKRNDVIEVLKSVAKYENVSLPGEELRIGDTIIRKGDIIRPWHLAALEAIGKTEIKILDLKAYILCTGDEFVKDPKFPPFTRRLVSGWLHEHGITVSKMDLSTDDVEEILTKILKALQRNDIIITLGGTSKGSRDNVFDAILKLNPSIIIRGLAVQPGKTASFYAINGNLIASLSGLPVAALSSLELALRPLLQEWIGIKFLPRPKVKAILTRRVTTKTGLIGFVRVKVFSKDGKLYAEPLMTGGSGAIRSLLNGNGILKIPIVLEGFEEGDVVEVELYGPV